MSEPQDVSLDSQRPRGSVIPYCVILGLISTPIICARLWTRAVLLRKFTTEDALIGIAMILNVVLLCLIGFAVGDFGYNSHTWQLSTAQLVHASEWLFVGDLLYTVTVGSTKAGILLFYKRLASASSKTFTYSVYCMLAEIIIYKTIYLFLTIFTCDPIQARWLRLDKAWTTTRHYYCINEGANILSSSTLNAVEDLIIALLPTLVIRQMNIPRNQKLALYCVFGISTFTAVFGFIRSWYIHQTFFKTSDWVWQTYWTWIFSGAEMTIGLICASVPVLKPFYNRYFKRDRGTIPLRQYVPRDQDPHGSGIGMYSWLRKARRQDIYQQKPGARALLNGHDTIFDGTTVFGRTQGSAPTEDSIRPRLTTTQSWATWCPSKKRPEDCEAASSDLLRFQRKKTTVQTTDCEDSSVGDKMFISVCSDVDVMEVAGENEELEHDWDSIQRPTPISEASEHP